MPRSAACFFRAGGPLIRGSNRLPDGDCFPAKGGPRFLATRIAASRRRGAGDQPAPWCPCICSEALQIESSSKEYGRDLRFPASHFGTVCHGPLPLRRPCERYKRALLELE